MRYNVGSLFERNNIICSCLTHLVFLYLNAILWLTEWTVVQNRMSSHYCGSFMFFPFPVHSFSMLASMFCCLRTSIQALLDVEWLSLSLLWLIETNWIRRWICDMFDSNNIYIYMWFMHGAWTLLEHLPRCKKSVQGLATLSFQHHHSMWCHGICSEWQTKLSRNTCYQVLRIVCQMESLAAPPPSGPFFTICHSSKCLCSQILSA